MAICYRFTCDNCAFAIEAWDEGNPFYVNHEGKKVYVYHPSSDRCLAIANDEPHLCLGCGKQVKIDSRLERKACTKCSSTKLVKTYQLEEVECPKCKKGHFRQEEGFVAIS